MDLDPVIRDEVIATMPHLRKFAISLSHNADRADDLVQETLLRALTHIDSFKPGTKLLAWLFTILRNIYYMEFRNLRREVQDTDGRYAARLTSCPEQSGRIEFEAFRIALAALPATQREALVLVLVSCFSYEEVAALCGSPAGTVKSRVNRARAELARLLSIENVDDFGPDVAVRAVLYSGTQPSH